MYHSIINSYNSLLTRIFDFSSDTEKIKHNLIFFSMFYIMEPIMQRVPLNINMQ